ncbi:methyltransferase domain-containing protein [Alginatibacterium sediminis]|uniref:Methyltransferase domain-containing protein n=1 Tax=Alginatibacterium sediminis TaxID=2164068 RepID=A0A420E828_9ALTE|nr:methyltransferase [Alginatibacterium sediminis]RKF15636.1 methyltransferase domain-containing protein [Alginatibacterium sediminis]
MPNFQSLQLKLNRYPIVANDSLQAWNAADELLIEHWLRSPLTSPQRIILINDDFGAIACAINKAAQEISHRISIDWFSDSYVAMQGLQQNLATTDLNVELRCHNSLADLPIADLVLYKVPKILRYQQFQLEQINGSQTAGTTILASGMLRAMPASVFKSFESQCDDFSTSLAKKKARLIFAKTQKSRQIKVKPTSWQAQDYPYQLSEHSNVFCQGKLDIGTRFMLQHLDIKADRVADLGCGNGLLGLHYLTQHPSSQLSFFDESCMAVASANDNLKRNLGEKINQCQFVQTNCLEGVADKSFDLILCNPPFHQQNTVSEHIAQQMFKDSRRCLKNNGRLRIVANRHLNYKMYLKPLFSNINLVASNAKFVILDALC